MTPHRPGKKRPGIDDFWKSEVIGSSSLAECFGIALNEEDRQALKECADG